MSLHIRHGVPLKQSPSSGLNLRCYTCLSLHKNLKPLVPANAKILTMLYPDIFCKAKRNTQYHICWECEYIIIKIKQFQARLIKACKTRRVITYVKDLSGLKLTGIEIIDIPPQMVQTDQPILREMFFTPGTVEIMLENEESGDYDELIQPSTIKQESYDYSTDTASETEMLMNEDPLLIPIQIKQKKKCVKTKVPRQKVVRGEIIAPRPEKVYIINEPTVWFNKESYPNLVKGKESIPIAVNVETSVPIIVKDEVNDPNQVNNKGSILNIVKGTPTVPKCEESIVATQRVPSNLDPLSEPVEPEWKLGIYGYKEDEVKCKILNRTELNIYREKKSSCNFFTKSKYNCKKCVESFNLQENLDEHNKKHDKSRGTSICEVCEQRFPDENVRNEHYNQHFIIFECLKCQYQNHDRLKISQHIIEQHEVSSFPCMKCNAVFKTYKEKRQHMIHVHSKRRNCEECNKTFVTLFRLKSHMTYSHRIELTECPICKKKFRKNYMEIHLKKKHNDTREDSAYCVDCKKTFKSQQSYENHLKTSLKHNTVEQIGFKCDHCNKYFPRTEALKNHVEEINRVRYKCHICNKEIKNKRLLASHIRVIHMGQNQKPRFKQRISLFECEHCGKSFSLKKTLERHINKHLGNRPLACKDCGASFIYSAALFAHRRLVH